MKQLFKTAIVARRVLITGLIVFACLATLIIGGGTFASKKISAASNSYSKSDARATKAGVPVAAATPGGVQPLAGTLDGQLWFIAQGGPADAVTGHVNSDGSNVTQEGAQASNHQSQTVAVDLAAGFYFTITGLSLEARAITDPSTVIDSVQIGNDLNTPSTSDDDIVNAVAIDPFTHTLYVGLWGQDLAHTGIVVCTYSTTNGTLDHNAAYGSGGVYDNNTTYLITSTSTGGKITDPRDFSIDYVNHKLYWTDDDNQYSIAPFGPTNNISVVTYNAPTPSTTVVQLSSNANVSGGFPTNQSLGIIGPMCVDAAKGLIYFETNHIGDSTGTMWYLPITSGPATATQLGLPGGTAVGFGDIPQGGISLDPQSQYLFITVQSGTSFAGPDQILQGVISADGHSITSIINTYPLATLDGHAPSANAHVADTWFDQLPTLSSLTATANHAGEQGASVTLLTGAPTITDTDHDHLASATVQITGGTFVANETSANDDHLTVNLAVSSGKFTGTNIAGSYNSATETLTLTGYDTLANYQTVLAAVQYNTTGDNPTNYGNNTTRTLHWTVSDGARSVPFGAQNSGSTTLTIDAVDDPPVNTVPGSQSVMEGSNLSVTTLHVSDLDADPANQNVTVTLSVLHGKVTVATNVASGLVAGDVTTNGTASVSITATQNKINTTFAAASSVLYKSGLYQGPETLTMLSNDQNHTGSGGPLTDSDGVGITVTAPQIDYAEASPGTCGGNDPCYPSVQSALTDVLNDGTGITNVVGGVFNESVTLNKNAATILNINGATTINDFTLTAGTLKGNSSTLTILGNWSKNGGTFTPGTGTVTFAGNGNTQTLSGNTSFNNLTINHSGANNVTASGSTLAVTGTLEVQSGTFISSSTFNNVQIDSGATLQSDGGTMNVTGNWTNNGGTFAPSGNTVNFNGSGAQTIGGSLTPQSFNNVTVNKSGGTLGIGATPTTLNLNSLTVTTGTFNVSNVTLNLIGSLNNAGTMTLTGSTVVFNASGGSPVAQTLTNTTAFNNLTINNTSTGGSVTLGSNITVNGTLTLTSDLTTTNAFTVSQPLSSITSGGGDVVGNLTRTNSGVQFPSATNITFGNPNTLLNFTAAGTRPTAINFRLTETAPTDAATGGTNTGFPGAVKRTWLITPTGGSGFSATMRLHYLVGDLNGNVETNPGPGSSVSLRLYKYVINSPGTGWQQQDFPAFNNTTIDTSVTGSHFVKLVGVTGFSPWTIGGVSPTATNSTVTGRILDDAGNPVEGAVIRLDGTQNRKTITDSQGNYSFAEVETNGFYTVTPSRVNYNFAPATRGFSALGAHTDASFAGALNGNHLNPLDTTEYFVRQQYVDFLGREPEEKGFNDWTDTINNCAAGDTSCDRVHVSESFFRSDEFQQRGYFVYRFYSTAFGQKPDYTAFAPDLGHVSGFLDATQLEAAKTQFAIDFTARAAFVNQYGMLSNSAYVDALAQTAGVNLSNRRALVDSLSAGTMTRAQALRQIVESNDVYAKYYNQAFVVMEYFGYLKRDPDLLYLNWIGVLDANPADSRRMVEGFVDATEYRNRFKQ